MTIEDDANLRDLDCEALLKKSLTVRTMRKGTMNLQRKIKEIEKAESALSNHEKMQLEDMMDKVAEVAANGSLE